MQVTCCVHLALLLKACGFYERQGYRDMVAVAYLRARPRCAVNDALQLIRLLIILR